MEIWLNPACQKCRTAVATLDEAGIDYTVRRYLDDAPTPAELAEVLDRLGLEPWDIARDKEAKEEGIDLPRTPPPRRLARSPRAAPARAPAADHHRRRRHHGRRPRPRRAREGRRGRNFLTLRTSRARCGVLMVWCDESSVSASSRSSTRRSARRRCAGRRTSWSATGTSPRT